MIALFCHMAVSKLVVLGLYATFGFRFLARHLCLTFAFFFPCPTIKFSNRMAFERNILGGLLMGGHQYDYLLPRQFQITCN